MRNFLALVCLMVACGASTPSKTDAQYRDEIAASMHDALRVDIQTVLSAAQQIELFAPAPVGRGWDAQLDAQSIATMKDALQRGRSAFERVEGAIAPTLGDLSFAMDSRYEDLLARVGPSGDPNPFDDQGVTGLDAIERILYSDSTPQRVVDYEKGLPGYTAAAFPATEEQARDFKNKLCQRLVSDAVALQAQWSSQPMDVGVAYGGLRSLIGEQKSELQRATLSAEESRYSQHTMDDLRAGAEGSQAIYGLFRPWLASKPGGSDVDSAIEGDISSIDSLYVGVPGDALPRPPPTWSSSNPSQQDLATPFGQLYQGVAVATDPENGAPAKMSQASALLGF